MLREPRSELSHGLIPLSSVLDVILIGVEDAGKEIGNGAWLAHGPRQKMDALREGARCVWKHGP
jgi:hypothetical protein